MNQKAKLFASAVTVTCLLAASAGAADLTATKSAHTVEVDGAIQNISAYMIGGNNYFKLRDIAVMVDGSQKQFEVSWSEAEQCISLISGQGYTAVGGELEPLPDRAQSAEYSTASIIKDGEAIFLNGYNINDNNYYKLRDVAYAFDFGVEWDEAAQTIVVDTGESYVPTAEEAETIARKAELYAQAQADLKDVEQQSASYDRQLEGTYIQRELNILSGKKYSLWRDAMSRMEDRIGQALTDDARAAFTALQQAWAADRDRHVKAAGMEFYLGSMQPMVENLTYVELTQQRIYDILVYLK